MTAAATPLWDAAEAAAATGGSSTAPWAASGVSIDSRSLAAGELFVALHGLNRDGHDFAAAAFARGAAAALVDRPVEGLPDPAPLLVVDDTLAALARLGAAARRRSAARVAAVTGSVGKTGTKEALRLALAGYGETAASAGSLNNHWGVPLSLARLSRTARWAVFELGMNHPGEIRPLARLVRPHVAVVTTIEAAHLGFFPSLDAIADAKAEIFEGLEEGGVAVLNRDNPYFDRLAATAREAGAGDIIGFGADPRATVRLLECATGAEGSTVTAALAGMRLRYRLRIAGRHWIMNSLAVLAALLALGLDPRPGAAALAAVEAPPGRGRRHRLPWCGGVLTVIDESYNASPAAVRAALAVLADTPPGPGGRRLAVLGDMLELGEESARLHRELAAPIAAARIDRVFLVGRAIKALHEALPGSSRGGLWEDADTAIPALLRLLQPGDVVSVKGSYAVGLGRVVERLCARSAEPET
jgi:UDP-N-acetylmuramoyl-tripeptide--D-alanyl-D-alanine ligase